MRSGEEGLDEVCFRQSQRSALVIALETGKSVPGRFERYTLGRVRLAAPVVNEPVEVPLNCVVDLSDLVKARLSSWDWPMPKWAHCP